MDILTKVQNSFNLDELTKQLQTVIDSGDPIGYMSTNINWEIDSDLEADDNKTHFSKLVPATNIAASYEIWNPLRGFLNWLSRKKIARSIKQIICSIAGKIQELIDEGAELKKILTVAITAAATTLGVGALNPVVMTLIVGMLAAAILKGVANYCAI